MSFVGYDLMNLKTHLHLLERNSSNVQPCSAEM